MLDGGKAGLTRESETRAAQRVTVEKVITGFKVKNCDQQKNDTVCFFTGSSHFTLIFP